MTSGRRDRPRCQRADRLPRQRGRVPRPSRGFLAHEIDDDFAANSLTLAEVLVVPARENRLEDVRAALADLDVQELALPGDAAVKLAQLRASTRLKLPDCCVLLAAEEEGARVASFDRGLTDVAISRHLTTVRG